MMIYDEMAAELPSRLTYIVFTTVLQRTSSIYWQNLKSICVALVDWLVTYCLWLCRGRKRFVSENVRENLFAKKNNNDGGRMKSRLNWFISCNMWNVWNFNDRRHGPLDWTVLDALDVTFRLCSMPFVCENEQFLGIICRAVRSSRFNLSTVWTSLT